MAAHGDVPLGAAAYLVIFGSCVESVPGTRVGVTMSLYQSIATGVGTREALELAHRLAAWHDAMVMHRRRTGDAASQPCDVDCPHDQAESLWLEALNAYGDRAHELTFLRSFGGYSSHQQNVAVSELRV